MRPLLLDLCCGAGLAAIGYHEAGFDVIGVDIAPQPNYPFTFLQGDALEVLRDVNFCRQFDAIHASFPCQFASPSTAQHRKRGKVYPDLVTPGRPLLDTIGLPYIMENVQEAPLRRDVVLHGYMFPELKVLRTRVFELGGWFMLTPQGGQRRGTVKNGDYCTIYGKGAYRTSKKTPPGWRPKFDQGNLLDTWHYAMGIPAQYRFKYTEISEGIPPAYTRLLGANLLHFLSLK